MGFPKAPRAYLGAWSSGAPTSISSPSKQTRTQARKNAWSRPAPWANMQRKPAAPIVTEAASPAPAPKESKPVSNGIPPRAVSAPIVYGLAPVEVPTSPVEFIKIAKTPKAEQPNPEGGKTEPAAIVTAFKMPVAQTPVERKSWTVTVEEVNWFEANEEVAVVASPEAPAEPSKESSPKPTESSWTTVARRPTNPRWKRVPNEKSDNRSSPRGVPQVRSSPGLRNRRGYGYHNRQQRTDDRQQRPNHRAKPKRSVGFKPVWRKVGSMDSAGEETRRSHSNLPFRQVSPTPSSMSEQSFTRPDSASSQTPSCETSSSSPVTQVMEPCPPRRSDPQVATVLKKMESLGTASAAWADEDDEMDW